MLSLNGAKWLRLLAMAGLVGAFGACTVVEESDDDDGSSATTAGPGSKPYNNDDVTCVGDTDCMDGEVCIEGVCQMERCGGKYQSLAPMGSNHYFGTDGELAIISDDTYVDGFEPSAAGYIDSWNLEKFGAKVVDVAGGDFTGERPQGVAVAVEFSDTVRIRQGSKVSELNIGIWPNSIAAGDVDADGLVELVAFAEDGSITLCHVDTKECEAAKLPGAKGKDVAVADVDGDGFAEPIFLYDKDGKSDIVVWNVDSETTGDEQSKGWQVNKPIRALSAGRFVADGVAEVALLEDGGWFGLKSDKVHFFSAAEGKIVRTKQITASTVDIAVGDADSDDIDEVVILRDDKKYEVMAFTDGQLNSQGVFPVNVGEKATRVSIVDWNGDSASGRLKEGPELIAGQTVPVAMLTFPPYPANVVKGATGALRASVSLGNSESTSESVSDTISLSLGLGIGVGVEATVFKAKVGAFLKKNYAHTKTITKTFSVGQRFAAYADPALYGLDYGIVVLSCGCFHRYRYETDDPANRIGGSGKFVDLFIPVGGQTTLWSTQRYNALAAEVGGLPIIKPFTRIGVMDSYPSQALTLAGNPIPEADLVFPDTPVFQVSDVGQTNFRISASETETNAVAETTSVGVKSSFGAYGVSVDSDISIGVTQGYSLRVGKSTLFMGAVPPVPDDPNTPEDEYKIHRYAFQPVVYREHYTNAEGEQTGFYVMTYAVK